MRIQVAQLLWQEAAEKTHSAQLRRKEAIDHGVVDAALKGLRSSKAAIAEPCAGAMLVNASPSESISHCGYQNHVTLKVHTSLQHLNGAVIWNVNAGRKVLASAAQAEAHHAYVRAGQHFIGGSAWVISVQVLRGARYAQLYMDVDETYLPMQAS